MRGASRSDVQMFFRSLLQPASAYFDSPSSLGSFVWETSLSGRSLTEDTSVRRCREETVGVGWGHFICRLAAGRESTSMFCFLPAKNEVTQRKGKSCCFDSLSLCEKSPLKNSQNALLDQKGRHIFSVGFYTSLCLCLVLHINMKS